MPAPHKQPHQTQWEKVKLGDIAEITAGQSPQSKFYSATQGMPFLQGSKTFGFKYPTIDTYTTHTTKIAKKGSILISVRAPVGDLNFAPFDICIGRGLASIEAKVGTNQSLWYILKFNLANILRQKNLGTTFDSISKETLQKMNIIAPPLATQKNIAQILSTLDKKIELNTRINTELESMAKLLYTRYFVEFNFPDSSGKPYKASGGAMVYSPTLKREIPQDWEVAKIGDLCSIQSGFAFSTKDFSSQGIYKLITIKNVKDGFISIDTDNKILMLPTKLPTFCRLKKGDILLSLTGNVGRVGMVWDKNLLLNQRVGIVQEKEANKSFLYCLFRSEIMKTTLENLAGGTSQDNLSPILTEKLWTLKPSKETLNKFHSEVSTILESILTNQQESQRLAEWRDYLLPLLMGDQVEVI